MLKELIPGAWQNAVTSPWCSGGAAGAVSGWDRPGMQDEGMGTGWGLGSSLTATGTAPKRMGKSPGSITMRPAAS